MVTSETLQITSTNLEINKKTAKLLCKCKIWNLEHYDIFIHLFQA